MTFMEDNLQDRKKKFVDLWAKYVLEHSDREWSEQQNVIINSCIRSSKITREDYLRMISKKEQ